MSSGWRLERYTQHLSPKTWLVLFGVVVASALNRRCAPKMKHRPAQNNVSVSIRNYFVTSVLYFHEPDLNHELLSPPETIA